VRANIHDSLVLPIECPTTKCSDWEEDPKLHRAYEPVIKRIKLLMSHGLMVMTVLHEFLSSPIAHLQDGARPTWLYTIEGDTTRLDHGCDSDVAPDVLGAQLGRLSPDPCSVGFITPPAICTPVCSDQAARMRLLRELPTLEDISIAV
jgi:hypothetical protein